MTTYAIGIVTHPARLEMATALANQVDADAITVDTDHLGERWCHTETLRQLASLGKDWCVWLEDDALPDDDFPTSIILALHATRPAIVSLYLGQGNWAGIPRSQAGTITALVTKADNCGAAWIDTDTLYHAVGVAIPTEWAPSIIAHLDESTRPTDRAISSWARDNDQPVRYTWPSIVDHNDNTPTLVTTATARAPHRVAWRTGTWHPSPPAQTTPPTP